MHTTFQGSMSLANAPPNGPPRKPVQLTEQCLKNARIENWEPGGIIYEHEEQLRGIYYTMRGEIHLTRLLEQGFRKTLHVVQNGHFFFEGLFFWPEPRVLTAHAHTAARTAFFARDIVPDLVENDPTFRLALFQSLAAKAINAGCEVVELAYSDAHARMLQVLHALVRLHGKSDAKAVEIQISQTELGERMGLHPVSINRTLRRLENEGCVKTGRQRIIIYPLKLPRSLTL